ncbi:MAG: 3-dehydroquinate synthase [Lentisphaeria bacterium]|nr:3-dehydroquinate synthase [Lentisphaeria bacterium]
MSIVKVQTCRAYEVRIEKGILRRVGELLGGLQGQPGKIAVISDEQVWSLHGAALQSSLHEAGLTGLAYCFAPGEASKNLHTVSEILEFLASKELTRSDLVLAFGGGVVGDMAGFCAAVYLRGIKYVQIPSSLLAMIDSSVGGKTGVDLAAGKNLAGAFWQPEAVYCDPELLSTLPEEILQEGMAEAIKYAVISDAQLFEALLAWCPQQPLDTIITRCIEIKSRLVCEDEFDRGPRQLLNFGHTIGHAIEKCSAFSIRHGQAVAMGMSLMAELAWRQGWSEIDCSAPIRKALQQFKLRTQCPYSYKMLCDSMLRDKKRQGDQINLVIPEKIGRCRLKKVPVSQLSQLFE